MKKIITVLMAVMFVFLFSACQAPPADTSPQDQVVQPTCNHPTTVGTNGRCKYCNDIIYPNIVLSDYLIKNGKKLSSANEYAISVDKSSASLEYNLIITYNIDKDIFALGSLSLSSENTEVMVLLNFKYGETKQEVVILVEFSTGTPYYGKGEIYIDTFSKEYPTVYAFNSTCPTMSLENSLKKLCSTVLSTILQLTNNWIEEYNLDFTLEMFGFASFK